MPKEKMQDNWDDLETFTSKGAKLRDIIITISEPSSIIFNAGFCHKAAISDKSHVVLSYSPQNRTIVFQFTSDSKALGALKLVQRSGGCSLGSRSFFNYYFLDPKKLAGRYEPVKKKLPKLGDVWVINIDKKVADEAQPPTE